MFRVILFQSRVKIKRKRTEKKAAVSLHSPRASQKPPLKRHPTCSATKQEPNRRTEMPLSPSINTPLHRISSPLIHLFIGWAVWLRLSFQLSVYSLIYSPCYIRSVSVPPSLYYTSLYFWSISAVIQDLILRNWFGFGAVVESQCQNLMFCFWSFFLWGIDLVNLVPSSINYLSLLTDKRFLWKKLKIVDELNVLVSDSVENQLQAFMNLTTLSVCFLHSFSLVFLYWFYVISWTKSHCLINSFPKKGIFPSNPILTSLESGNHPAKEYVFLSSPPSFEFGRRSAADDRWEEKKENALEQRICEEV